MHHRVKAHALLVALAVAATLVVPVAGSAAGFQQVSVGNFHACALTSGGGIFCWGDDSSGQLGDGENVDGAFWRNVPVAVAGLTSGAAGVDVGLSHSCAVTTAGTVKCWGANGRGQLGDGTLQERLSPVDVAGVSGVSAVSAGSFHTCALAGGAVWCWGRNDDGQLGTGTTTDATTPVQVIAGGVQAVSAGANHTCAVLTDGTARCWGDNTYGQLGDGTTSDRPSPTPVVDLTGVTSVSAGGTFGCARTASADAFCWGSNAFGELGTGGSPSASTRPVAVTALAGIASSVAVGAFHGCAVTTAGSLQCWGYNNWGQLGNGVTGGQEDSPGAVIDMGSGVLSAAAGASNTCAVTTGGLYCWGSNEYGQLGNGSDPSEVFDSPVPVKVVFPDSTPPAITKVGEVCTVKGNKGWCKGAVQVTFSATDAESGVDSPCSAPAGLTCTFTVSSSTNGSSVTIASGSVCDAVGNCDAGISAGPFKIDTVAPTLACGTAPTFTLGQTGATVSASVSDATSGVSVSSVSAAADTSRVGTFTASLSATDVAGNTGTAACGYRVIYKFTGYLSPVENPPVENLVKAGARIPVKFSLNGYQGMDILAPGYPVTFSRTCGVNSRLTLEVTTETTIDGLKYDAVEDHYVIGWKTDVTWATTCRTFRVVLIDGTVHDLWIQFR